MAPVMTCNAHRIYPHIALVHTSRHAGPAPTLHRRGGRTAFASALGQDANLDLQVTYAIHSSTPCDPPTPLTSRCLMALGLDPQALHEQALHNLLRKAGPNIATQDLTAYKVLVTGDDLEASMLLLPELWASLSQGFKGELIATVPSQNALYYMDSGATLTIAGVVIETAAMLELMCLSAARVKAEAGVHGLSDKVLALTPEGWKVRGTLHAHASVLAAGG